MKTRSIESLPDHLVVREVKSFVVHDCRTTAGLLVRLGVFDERELYKPTQHPSTYAYCVGELGMSDDVAFKRIRAARTARRFPAIVAAVADGRLNLSAVVMLAPHLTPETANELLAAAAHRTNAELERLLAERFPRPDVPTLVVAIEPSATGAQLAVRPVDAHGDPGVAGCAGETMNQLAVRPVDRAAARAKVAPLAPQKFALQVTIDQETHDLLREVQDLLGHSVPSGDVAAVLREALRDMAAKLRKRRYAATEHPRLRRSAADGRRVPTAVQRAVWERDGGRCTFVSEGGHRCEARRALEFDHVIPVARGGKSTVENVRLRCRPHNQYGAECDFGSGFMDEKRKAARARSAAEKERKVAAARAAREAETRRRQALAARNQDVSNAMRNLGYSAGELRYVLAQCEAHPHATVEECVRLGLRLLAPGRKQSFAPSASISA